VGSGGKAEALTLVLREASGDQALVFCKTKRRSDRVGQHLTRAGIASAVIHGNKSQGARQRALNDFKAGRVTILVATDIAARGLDIDGIHTVINFEVPDSPDTYVHRVGRTGRADEAGHAITLVAPEERRTLAQLEKTVGIRIE